jgi:hypothetical protein
MVAPGARRRLDLARWSAALACSSTGAPLLGFFCGYFGISLLPSLPT